MCFFFLLKATNLQIYHKGGKTIEQIWIHTKFITQFGKTAKMFDFSVLPKLLLLTFNQSCWLKLIKIAPALMSLRGT